MSETIDSRVVDMRFNNGQFEQGASQTLSTLEKLKQSLKFQDGSKGLDEIQSKASRFNMNGLADALSFASNKFSLFELAGITAFTNIVNRGVNMLTSKVKDLTFGQVTSGWSKYAEKTSAVQTIMAATAGDFKDTGEQMDYVNGQLEKLNWFTDETSFNFLDMVNNIGKFTANKVPLDQAVTSMQGISTWAAISGANVQEAGRAMYNLSQAIAVGSVKLMDWKSIENANMATAEFKQTVIDTAIAEGTLVKKGNDVFVKGNKKALVSVKNFNSELSKGWFTGEVLQKALNKYGAFTNKLYEFSDATGLIASDILEIIDGYRDGSMTINDIMKELGDTDLKAEEVESMLKGMTDVSMELGEKAFRAAQEAKTFQEAIGSVADAVSTGWMQTFEYIFGDYEHAKKLWTAVANELYDIFAEGGNKRNEILKQWSDLGGREIFLEALANAWNSLRNVMDLVGESFRSIFPETTADRLMDFTKKLNDATLSFKNFFKVNENLETDKPTVRGNGHVFNNFDEGLDKALRNNAKTKARLDNLSRAFKGLFAAADIVARAFGAAGKAIGRFIGYLIPAFDSVTGLTGSFGDWLVMLDETIKEQDTFNTFFEKLDPILKAVADGIKYLIDTIGSKLGDFANLLGLTAQNTEEMGEKVKTAFSPFEFVANIVNGLIDLIKKAHGALQPIVSSLLGALWNKITLIFTAFKNGMKSGEFGDFMNIIKTGALAVFLKKISDGFDRITGYVSSFDKIKEKISDFIQSLLPVTGSKGTDTTTNVLKLAAALGILAVSLVLISGVDPTLLWGSILAIAALTKIIEQFMATLNTIKKRSLGDLESVFVNFAQTVGKNITGTMQGIKWSTMAVAILMFAGAIAVLAGSLVALAGLSWEGILKGLVGIGALAGILLIVTKALTKMGGTMTAGLGGLASMATAVQMLSSSIVALSSIEDPEALMRSVGAITIIIGALTLFSKFSEKINLSTGLSMIALAAAVNMISKSMEQIGGLDEGSIVKGLLGITGILTAMVAFSVVVSQFGSGGKMLAGALGAIALAAALRIVSTAIERISKIPINSLTNAVSALGIVMISMAAMTVFMKGGFDVTIAILSLSVGILAIANALSVVAKIPIGPLTNALLGLAGIISIMILASNFSDAGGAGAIALMSVSLLILAGAFTLLSTIPMEGIVQALVAFGGALLLMAIAGAVITPAMAASFLSVAASIALFGAGILMAAVGITAFTTAIGLAMGALKILAVNIKAITVLAVLIVLGFINGIMQMLPLIVQTAIAFIITFIYTTAVAIAEYAPMILKAVGVVLEALWALIVEAVAMLLEQIPGIGKGLGEKVRSWKPDIQAAADEAFADLPKTAGDSLDSTADAVGDGGKGVLGSLFNMGDDFKGAGSFLAGQTGDGMADLGQIMKEYGIEGWENYTGTIINEGGPKAKDAGEEIKDETVEGTKDKEGFKGAGSFDIDGYIEGILSRKRAASNAGSEVASVSLKAMKTTLAEKSPSKITRGFGINVVLGYVGGIFNRAKEAATAGKYLANESLNAISNAISSASDIFSADADLSPVITPVVNLDGVQAGVGVMNGLLNSKSVSLAADANLRFNASRRYFDEQRQAELESFNTALSGVNEKLDELNNSGQFHFEMPVTLNGREIARGTAEYTREELNKLDRINARKGGKL